MRKKIFLLISLLNICFYSFTALASSANQENSDDLFTLSLEELMNVEIRVDVASLFEEEERVAGSSVSSIDSKKWNVLGARRLYEALGNEPGIMVYDNLISYVVSIRGYTNPLTNAAALLDGVPLNDLREGSIIYTLPNWELGTLNKIELIKGPGSAIYGSDAFHGVISLKAFESDEDICVVEGRAGYPLYGDANIKISEGLANDNVRVDFASSVSGQGDLDMDYEYDAYGLTGTGNRKFQYDSWSGHFKIRANPQERLKIKIGAYANRFNNEDFTGIGSTTYFPGTLDKDLSSADMSLYMGNGSLVYELNHNILIEVKGFGWIYDSDSKAYLGQLQYPEGYTYGKLKQHRFGGECAIKQRSNKLDLQWFLAYSFNRLKIESNAQGIKMRNGLAYVPQIELPSSGFSREVNSHFGQIKWGVLKEKFYLLAGYRLDHYSDFGSQVTPRGGIIWLPTDNATVKTLYGRAFRAPSGQNIYGYGQIISGNPDLEPEIIDVYELIYTQKGKNWKFISSGFYSQWKEGIVVEFDPKTSGFSHFNRGKNQAIGAEVNGYVKMGHFALDMGIAYVKSKAIDVLDMLTMQRKDHDYDAYPEYTAHFGLHYFIESWDANIFINNRLFVNMKETASATALNPDSLPPYYRADLHFSKNIKNKLMIDLDIRNLFNRENRIPAIYDVQEGIEEPGISAVLGATYKF